MTASKLTGAAAPLFVFLSACAADLMEPDDSAGDVARELLPQDYECPVEALYPCEPTPPPPEPPTTPASISYGLYRTSGSFPVSWSSSYGGGLSVYYELEESRNGSYWTPVYQGYSTSTYLGNRMSGVYSYRVRACNSVGCSWERSGNKLVVNTRPTMNVYAQYPFLYAHDQQNAAYQASSPGIRGEFLRSSPTAGVAPVAFNTGNFHLGQGFNLTKDTYSGICINTTQPGLGIVTNPINTNTYIVDRSESVSHLYQLLEVSAEAGISFNMEGYSADLTANRRRFTESVADEYREVIVVRWRRDAEHWTLNTSVNPLKSEFASSMLVPNNPNAQAAFREVCGDKYIYAADLGATLYMVFSFDTKSYKSEERDQKALNLEAAIQGIVSANGAGSVSQATRTLLEQLNVSVAAYTVGGPQIGTVSRLDFDSKLNAFINGIAPSNYAAVKHHTRHYDHPTQFLNYGYFEIFADYRTPLAQLRRWNAIDFERERRCDMLSAHGQPPGNCPYAQQELETAKSMCIETLSWNRCLHPASYYAPGYDPENPGPLPANVHLHSWLGSNVKDFDENVQGANGDFHVVRSSYGSKKCINIDLATCLPAGCFEDKFKGYDRGQLKGFGYKEYYWDAPGGGSNTTNMATVGSARCVRTTGQVCTSAFGDSTGDHQFFQEVFGQCPVARSFPILN